MIPGDQIRFWDKGRHRAGFVVRIIGRGRKRGWIIARVAGKTMEVDPATLITPTRKEA